MSIQAIFLLGLVVAVAIFDVAIILSKGKKSSISAWAVRTSYKYPSIVFLVAFGLGYVFGHTTWRMKTLDIYECSDNEVQDIIKECIPESASRSVTRRAIGLSESITYNKNKKSKEA